MSEPASPETNPPVAVVSGQGEPMIPKAWVPALTIVGAVLAVIGGLPVVLASAGIAAPGWLAVVGGIAGSVGGLLASLGIASPGWRK